MHTIIEHSRRDMLYARLHRARARRLWIATLFVAGVGLLLAAALGLAAPAPGEFIRPAAASSE